MATRDLINSIKSSIGVNGLWKTVQLGSHYTRFKQAPGDIYTFSFHSLQHPVSLRPRTSDFSVFRQIFMNDEYGIDFQPPPRTIIDAGANIGLASVYFVNRFPSTKVVAIEPEPDNLRIATMNVASYSNIRLVAGALWNERTTLTIQPGADKWSTQVKPEAGTVKAMTVPDIMLEFGFDVIDLLKIDIEGAEMDLFKGDCSWLKKVRVLVIELHENLRPGCTALLQEKLTTINHRLITRGENVVVYNQEMH